MQIEIEDYNIKRPHGTLNSSTPFEAFKTTPWDRSAINVQFEQARLGRLAINRKDTCKGCE